MIQILGIANSLICIQKDMNITLERTIVDRLHWESSSESLLRQKRKPTQMQWCRTILREGFKRYLCERVQSILNTNKTQHRKLNRAYDSKNNFLRRCIEMWTTTKK